MPIAFDSIRRARPLLGTFVEIEVTTAAGPETDAAIDAAFEAIAETHRLMSFHEHDSDVSRLNRDAGIRLTRVHPWTFQVLEAAVEMHRRSSGVFDITVAPVLQAMGLLPGLDGDPVIAPERRVTDAIELSSEQTVRFRSPAVTIDLGGIAKGFAVDRGIEVLRGFDIPCGLISAGGDLRAFGQESHMIHIRDPRDPSRLIGQVEVRDGALASSARRIDLMVSGGPSSSAVIDPQTQRPADSVDGVTIRAPSCMIADALTKVAMISGSGAGDLLAHYGASALLISVDGEVQITSDWPQGVHLAA